MPPVSPVVAPVDRPRAGAPVNRTLQWVVWAAMGLLLAGIGVGFVRQQWRAMERRSYTVLDRFKHVPAFSLTERNGQAFDSGKMLAGKVWLADFFFTACPGPCLLMNKRMQEIQQALSRDHADVRLVSFSIAPEADTPPVLAKYAQRFQASDHWAFLTGDHGVIYGLAREAFLLPTVDNQGNPKRQPDEGDFIHSEKIVLVDRQGVVRKYFDSTSPEILQQVLTAVGDLLREQPDRAATTTKAGATLQTGT